MVGQATKVATTTTNVAQNRTTNTLSPASKKLIEFNFRRIEEFGRRMKLRESEYFISTTGLEYKSTLYVLLEFVLEI